MSSPTSTVEPANADLLITRTFQAPRELVWKAWTDPQMLMQWICPHNFTVLFAENDLRVGGSWKTGMRSAEGEEYMMSGVYQEISPPWRLVMTHVWNENSHENMPVRETLITVELFELEGRTTMAFRHAGLPTIEIRDDHRIGWNGAFDHLNEFALRSTSEVANQEITLSRTFPAPKDLVFEVWTKPEHVENWWGPDGFTITTHQMDFRVGGMWRYIMHGPDGTDFPNRIVYTLIEPTDRIEYDHSDDGDTPAIFFKAKITFEEMDGETTVTLNSKFPSPEALQAVMQFGVIEGGRQHLASLANYVAERRKL